MRNHEEENQEAQQFEDAKTRAATLLEDFFGRDPRKTYITGLELMFINYFKQKRYFETEDDTTAVLECYHLCSYFLSNKQLFNQKNIA